MNSKEVDTMHEAVDAIQRIKWLIDEGPAHEKLTEAQVRLTNLKTILSSINPEAIRTEAVLSFWKELQFEAGAICDERERLLGPIKTSDDAAFRKTLGDGWSAWLLARHIINDRHIKIEGQAE